MTAADVGSIVIVIALWAIGLIWGLFVLARRTTANVQRAMTERIGVTAARLGGTGLDVGLGRLTYPMLLIAGALIVGVVIIASLTWTVPHTPLGIAVGGVLAVLAARAIPRRARSVVFWMWNRIRRVR